ncbi:hypothetical protein Gbro_4123 [Gordonia bronchialis DSM 43247]|jgi:hypothetical protein|uniref:Uncharacterized protein n=2 Tax=Gordonia bronchialis TaxID=2054 RepID=D0L4R0_GORB4|nr:hypothetical protein [Gordonia bronchialis]ACY23285.1 hypothetical protein Gbro_4123 [Gordonia bronchialis DSM 43247]UAK36313.1 hypothetical protein K8O93_13315 [Gordonia bronchialis]STQ66256.1 Uncharacterised protein [Gordonia bronchialis]
MAMLQPWHLLVLLAFLAVVVGTIVTVVVVVVKSTRARQVPPPMGQAPWPGQSGPVRHPGSQWGPDPSGGDR